MGMKQNAIDLESSADSEKFANRHVQLPKTATTSLATAAAGNEGSIVYDSTTNTVKFSDGSSWDNVGAGASATLDEIFDNGQAIDSAAVAKKLTITGGGATLSIWDDLTDIQLSSDADMVITGTEVKLVAADTIVGTGAATADLMSSGNFDLVMKTGNATTGSITITDGASGNITIAPNGTGELVIGSGSASGKITTNGAYDVVIDTNSGTNSGSITITDGANGDIDITPNGSGVVDLTNAITAHPIETVAAGTATLAVTNEMHTIHVSTDGAAAHTSTLPDASTALGQEFIVFFDTDGGVNCTVACATGDSYYASGDIGDNTATMADAGDFIVVQAVAGNKWIVKENNGVTFSTTT